MVKLDKWDIIRIRQKLETGLYTHKQLAEMYNVSRGHITKIKNKKRWKIIYGYEQS